MLAYDLNPKEECIAMGVKYVEMDQLLATADVVSLHCPLTPSTFHIINEERYSPNITINTSTQYKHSKN